MNTLSIIEKYYQSQKELYDILVNHSKDVASMALSVCSRHKELNADEKFIEEASMLHDIGIIETNAPKIKCFGKFPYIMHGYIGAEMLRKEGFPRHADVCQRHTGTGLTEEDIESQSLPLPKGIYVPVSIEEQIICYADKFFSKTKLGKEKSIDKIIKNLRAKSELHVEKFLKWHEMFE